MPVLRRIRCAPLACAVLLLGCPASSSLCPEATVVADPVEIPAGVAVTNVVVEVVNPNPGNGLDVLTELTTVSGTIADPFARETTYACAHDVSGPVEICAKATYFESDGDAGMPEGGMPEGGMPEAGIGVVPQGEDASVAASQQYLGKPHVRLSNPLVCSQTKCTTVICPEDKNTCPVASSITVDPMMVPEDGTTTITVVAEDPDDGPEPLVTTLTALHGTIADPNALSTTYTCDPDVGGIIQICVVASDGDEMCESPQCTSVLCPGEPLDNTCPIIESFTANPNPIAEGDDATVLTISVTDPDDFPGELVTELTSDGGGFVDRFATQTVFRCGERGPVEVELTARDGDEVCDQTRTLIVQCPSDVRLNICPMLFVINAIPRSVPPGQTSTTIETRAQDTDGLPAPLTLTLRAPWGTLQNTANIQEPNNVVAQNATYNCVRPGQVEVCVDATDGACNKTQCDIVTCPNDIPIPP